MTRTVFEVLFELDLSRLGTVWLWVTAVTVRLGLVQIDGRPNVKVGSQSHSISERLSAALGVSREP